jgi:hypothetical protein|tara:strand:+ start:2394 stop:4952 length:2559 start_codon:yes stop_codon:yes gene_type:complete
MRKKWFACATISILCYSLSLEINTTYGEQRISLVRPVETQYPISKLFDPSKDLELQAIYKEEGLKYEGHFGIDYKCPVGTDIFACDDGEVFEVNDKKYNGLYVRIRHKWGSSVYLHLSEVKVKNGERVEKQSVIGLSGNTGLTTGPHLHFGMTKISNHDYIDPLKHASFESPVTQLSTSKLTEQKKSPEVTKSPEYSQETLRLRERIKVYKNKLQSVSSQLLRNIPNPPSIEFKLTASEEVNAWIDGRITMGLMDFLYGNPARNPDDQLAMIMAHIITHEKLKTESVNKMLEGGLRDERVNLDNKMAIFDIAFSVLKFFGPVPVAAEITKLGGEKVGKAVYDWQAERILEALKKKQENTSHFFSILYLKKAGFDASEGLEIFKNPTQFSRQHPIDRQFWKNYTKEVQAKLDNERQLAAETLTEQKKSPEVAKLPEFSQKTSLPNKATIEDGLIKQKGSYKIYLLIDGKRFFIPDRATLKSLNFGGQNVRVLTSDVFNSIPEGNSVEAKEVFALRKKGKQLTTQAVQKLPSMDQRVYSPGVQKVGKNVQELPSTKVFNMPHVYTKTAKNIEKPSTEGNFVPPDVYNRSKSYSSLNMPSYDQGFSGINNLNGMNELTLLEIEILEELTKGDWEKGGQELRKAFDKNPMDAFANSTGYMLSGVSKNNPSLERKLRQYQRMQERLLKTTKQTLRQQLTNQQYGLGYNQGVPYQTTPMITNQNKGYAAGLEMMTMQDKEENTGYTDGIDRIKNNSTSDFNTQYRIEGVRKVLEDFGRWQTDYFMKETKRLAANKKYFTTVNAMSLKEKGIDKVWDSILYAAENNDIVGLEKSIEVYKELIKSELRILKNQKTTQGRP